MILQLSGDEGGDLLSQLLLYEVVDDDEVAAADADDDIGKKYGVNLWACAAATAAALNMAAGQIGGLLSKVDGFAALHMEAAAAAAANATDDEDVGDDDDDDDVSAAAAAANIVVVVGGCG